MLNLRCSLGSVLAFGLLVGAGILSDPTSSSAAPSDEAHAKTEPVEPDMHEFMEYVFQPGFKRLNSAMAAAPENNAGWKTIKAESLVLAEGGNLLLDRLPEEHTADWTKHSTAVRGFGKGLYQAAKAKDFPAAREQYQQMVKSCNACHQQFAGGEHILEP